MIRRACPKCAKPTVGPLRLFALGGIRTSTCEHCGTIIGLSKFSSFVLFALGTWLPVLGGLAGAVLAAGVFNVQWPIGAGAGAALAAAAFGVVYFRRAALVTR